jgi:hypothetical protein
MNDDKYALVAILGALAFFLAFVYLLTPSKMEICLKYGYEYTDGNCEGGLTNE